MSVRVGIMGFGRIGRNVFRIIQKTAGIEVPAIADVADPKALEYLLRFDTVHGHFSEPFSTQATQAADFPNGVPVASDASMKDWMGYVYQQKPLPTNFTGVDVTINVLDSNNNFRSIGTATTDESGMYSLTWKPDIPGDFKVFASFAGSNGYWPSSSETTFTVSPAHPTTAPTAAPPASMTDTYVLATGIAVIVVLVIIGAAIMLMLRKRP